VVLVHVLWGLGLLSILALSVLPSANGSYRQARLIVEEAQFEAQMAGIINTALLRLLDPRPEHRWPADRSLHDVRFDATHARVSIQEEIGRIDINQANRNLLIGLFRSVELDGASAAALAERILYWRDARAALPQKYSVDRSDVDDEVPPRRAPFQSVDELLLVPGMTVRLYERVVPAITVYSGRPTIDPRVAAPEALRAVQIASSDSGLPVDQARTVDFGARAAGGVLPLAGRAFRVRADAVLQGRARWTEVVVRVTDDPAQPLWVLDWRNR
jgi:general secretion pathway protein K